MPTIPMSEWLWTWQWYIHAPGPTRSPAISWNPNDSAGPVILVSMIRLGSSGLSSMPVRLSAQRCPWMWNVW